MTCKINSRKWLVLVTGLFLFMSQACRKKNEPALVLHYAEGNTMNTTYHIKWLNGPSDSEIKLQVDSMLILFNKSLSTYDSTSVISAYNHNTLPDSFWTTASQPEAQLREWFLKVCYRSADIFHLSQGAFDPAAAPLFRAWGFAEDTLARVPAQRFIDSCKSFANMSNVKFTDGIPIKNDPRISLNFNAIAGGYAVDVVAALLEENNIDNYMVEIGGEVRCMGKNAEGHPWVIGINVPDEKASAQDVQVYLSISNKSLNTSGNYRHFFVENGVRYSHTIDPRNGYPARNEILSASVLAPDCMTADALATACMVLGRKQCMDLIGSDSTVEVLLLYTGKNGKISSEMSAGMREIVVKP